MFQQAVLKDPSYADAYAGLADSYTLLASYGVEPEQEAYPNAKAAALQQAQTGRDLDPLSLMGSTELGRVYYWNRQYDKAVEVYRHAIELDLYFARAHTRLGMALAAQKRDEDAIHEFEETQRLSGPDSYVDGLIGYAEAQRGNTSEARRILEEMVVRSKQRYVPAFSVALLFVGLGEQGQAMDWLDRAYQDRSTYMVYAKVDPLLDPLRANPRFMELMKRMDLLEGTIQSGVSKTLVQPK